MWKNDRTTLWTLRAFAVVHLSAWMIVWVAMGLSALHGGGEVSLSGLLEGVPWRDLWSSLFGASLLAVWLGSVYVWALRLHSHQASVATLALLLFMGLFWGGIYLLLFSGTVFGRDSGRPG